MGGCFLELYVTDYKDDTCDGCGKTFAVDEKRIDGIESCCGSGCTRSLCQDCVCIACNLLGITIG